jgi:hypothetical protein
MDSIGKVSEMLSEVSEGFSAPSAKEKTQDRLERLGFKTAATKIKKVAEAKRKLAIAYEHYRFVTSEKMQAFQIKLRDESMKKLDSGRSRWKELVFTPLHSYQETPPAHVLDSLEKANDRKCFDSFTIAHIVNVEDPILFGYIQGCTDHFYIDQWDDDVKIQRYSQGERRLRLPTFLRKA